MHAVQCANGVCVKIEFGEYEVSIAFENAVYERTLVIGRMYPRSDIRVYRGNKDITEHLFPEECLRDEVDLLKVMKALSQRSLQGASE